MKAGMNSYFYEGIRLLPFLFPPRPGKSLP